MTDYGERIAAAAEACLGARFRLHGRRPDTGIDCVGLALWSCRQAGLEALDPHHYGLRNLDIARLLPALEASGLKPAEGHRQRGDILLVQLGPAQHHLLIATGPAECVHAHAGLRRVVASTLQPDWRVIESRRAIPIQED